MIFILYKYIDNDKARSTEVSRPEMIHPHPTQLICPLPYVF